MGFRIVTGLCLLILAYAGFEAGRLLWLSHRIDHPKAGFLVEGPKEAKLTVIEYVDYRCPNCAAVYTAMQELKQQRPDLRYITIPLPAIDERSVDLTRFVLAAGKEGKFREIHEALIERRGDIPESFLRETASLYGLDYSTLAEQGIGQDVEKLLQDIYEISDIAGVTTIPSYLVGNGYYTVQNPIENATVTNLLAFVAQEENNL